MSNANHFWHFSSTDDWEVQGINDALTEHFEGDYERYIAREVIQNSLDVQADISQPVRVAFKREDLPIRLVPGLEQLRQSMNRAKDFCLPNEAKAQEFYKHALHMLDQETIPVLRIGDYNTKGLEGADDDRAGNFHKLVRAQGVNVMQGDGGGSFGIGKGAPFAASALRTVFYSSCYGEGKYVFCGKARLSSYEDAQGKIHRGTGQFGVRKDGNIYSIRGISQIPRHFQRMKRGTDLHIMGYQTKDNLWVDRLLNSLLNNFWAAIHHGSLEVLIDDNRVHHAVNKGNLETYLEEFASGKNDSHVFYQAFTKPTRKFTSDLKLLGRSELYVKLADNFPKAVQMMRKSRMAIFHLRNFRILPDQYAAVFLCKNEKGNKLLRAMEPPKHDNWDAKRHEQGDKIYQEFRDWIKESLKQLSTGRDITDEEIPGLSNYLPLPDDEKEDKQYDPKSLEDTSSPEELEADREIGKTQEGPPTQPEWKPIEGKVPVLQGASQGVQPTQRPLTGPKSANRTGQNQSTGDESGGIPKINPAHVRLRSREVYRGGKRIYRAILSSQNHERGAIRLVAIGDDETNYPLDISRITDNLGNELPMKAGFLMDLDIQPGQSICLMVELRNDRRCIIGVG